MDFRFIKQRVPDSITTLDEIDLYNCTDGYMPGHYKVASVEPDTGEVVLVGMGKLQGHVAMVVFGEDEQADAATGEKGGK